MKVTGKKLSELASEMTIFPQKLINVRVTDKHAVTENEKVAAIIGEVETEMAWRWSCPCKTFRHRAISPCDGRSTIKRIM